MPHLSGASGALARGSYGLCFQHKKAIPKALAMASIFPSLMEYGYELKDIFAQWLNHLGLPEKVILLNLTPERGAGLGFGA